MGGRRLALVAEPDGGLVELLLERRDAIGGHAWLLVDDPSSAAAFAAALAGVEHRTSRASVVQRGGLRTIAAMAHHVATHAGRSTDTYPHAALGKLQRGFPHARPMVGVNARLGPQAPLEPNPAHIRRAWLRAAFGAAVTTKAGPRAVLWDPETQTFSLPPGVRRSLVERLGGKLSPVREQGMAIAAVATVDMVDIVDDDDERTLDVTGSTETVCDLCDLFCDLDVTPGCGDLGVAFDCSALDCGALDCVGLDCSF